MTEGLSIYREIYVLFVFLNVAVFISNDYRKEQARICHVSCHHDTLTFLTYINRPLAEADQVPVYNDTVDITEEKRAIRRACVSRGCFI